MPFQQATKNRFLQFDIKVTQKAILLCIKITNRAGSRSLGIIIRLPFQIISILRQGAVWYKRFSAG